MLYMTQLLCSLEDAILATVLARPRFPAISDIKGLIFVATKRNLSHFGKSLILLLYCPYHYDDYIFLIK